MSCQRSEYEDKRLKKNAFKDRLLKLELDKLDSQKAYVSNAFRQERHQLERQFAQEQQNVKQQKCLSPDELQLPLSPVDLKKLSPQFVRRYSCTPRLGENTGITLPQINTTSKQISSSEQFAQRRRSLLTLDTPTITVQDTEQGWTKRRGRSDISPRLLRRRGSAQNTPQDNNDFSERIREFLVKLKNDSKPTKEKAQEKVAK